MTIYEALYAAGCQLDHHESDLYVKATDASRKILQEYQIGHPASTFVNQIDGCLWYDLPFKYDPFWQAVARRSSHA